MSVCAQGGLFVMPQSRGDCVVSECLQLIKCTSVIIKANFSLVSPDFTRLQKGKRNGRSGPSKSKSLVPGLYLLVSGFWGIHKHWGDH